eukprot:scaffold10327_cov156-Cylindrotheca_fusiformis.AAC.1
MYCKQEVPPMTNVDPGIGDGHRSEKVGVDRVCSLDPSHNWQPNQTVGKRTMLSKQRDFEHETFRASKGKNICEGQIGPGHDPTIAFNSRRSCPSLLATKLQHLHPQLGLQRLIWTNVLTHPCFTARRKSLIPQRGRLSIMKPADIAPFRLDESKL